MNRGRKGTVTVLEVMEKRKKQGYSRSEGSSQHLDPGLVASWPFAVRCCRSNLGHFRVFAIGVVGIDWVGRGRGRGHGRRDCHTQHALVG
jgi:hypothetical protein